MSLGFRKINNDVEIWQDGELIGSLYKHARTEKMYLDFTGQLCFDDEETTQLCEAIKEFQANGASNETNS